MNPPAITAIVAVALALAGGAAAAPPAALEARPGAVLVAADWADGDSFPVKFPDGRTEALRLYGVDCFETNASDDSLARRLREQRAHFGFRGIAEAVRLGLEAKAFTATLLADPFVVHTRWERAPGRAGLPRFYAFVITAQGKDLAAELVAHGLARAHGVARPHPDGAAADEYAARLGDLESVAALKRLGGWKHSDPDGLAAQRREFRAEERNIEDDQRQAAEVNRQALRIDPNVASPDELDRLPGVGPVLAQRILQGRPYAKAGDLLNVEGIGPRQLQAIKPFLIFPPRESK